MQNKEEDMVRKIIAKTHARPRRARKTSKTHTEEYKEGILSEQKHIKKKADYKDQLLEINSKEESYDELFDKKLTAQYTQFRQLKEHNQSMKRFMRILIVIMTLIIVAIVIMSV